MTLSRRQLADRATELAGGVPGFTVSHDPRGCFELVTEGRQRENTRLRAAWAKRAEATRGPRPPKYSACEDLATRLAFELCGPRPWINREEAGHPWRPTRNWADLRTGAGTAARAWGPHSTWTLALGDAVQVIFASGLAHVLVLTEIRYDEAGAPVSVDLAEYGQVVDPDGASGPAQLDDGCRCRVNVAVTRRADGWYVGSGRIYSSVDLHALQDRTRDTDPAPVPPPPSRPEQPTLPEPVPGSRTLRIGCTGADVRELQRRVGAVTDAAFGPATLAAVQRWQQSHGLLPDGVVGPRTWAALGVT